MTVTKIYATIIANRILYTIMTKFLIIDTANTFARAKHAAPRGTDIWTRIGFAVHVTIGSVGKCWRTLGADHVVFCLEGRSWRKDYYPPYKRQRKEAREAMTEQQQDEEKEFWGAFDDLTTFLKDKSNCTVLQHSNLEADDLIAGWIQSHPHDEHVIISSDTDYLQLLSPTVTQYNGITDEHITSEGIYNARGKLVNDKKTGLPKSIPDPKWELFKKCMRGDTSDNVFSAYPGVREKGSSKKVGLLEAFADKDNKGYAWNNMMLQRWTDHNNEEHRVLDDYERNRTLIDLTAQPDDIKDKILETIKEGATPLSRPMVGVQFMKFCSKYELNRINDNSTEYARILATPYPAESQLILNLSK